jgi:hypothetical protein
MNRPERRGPPTKRQIDPPTHHLRQPIKAEQQKAAVDLPPRLERISNSIRHTEADMAYLFSMSGCPMEITSIFNVI